MKKIILLFLTIFSVTHSASAHRWSRKHNVHTESQYVAPAFWKNSSDSIRVSKLLQEVDSLSRKFRDILVAKKMLILHEHKYYNTYDADSLHSPVQAHLSFKECCTCISLQTQNGAHLYHRDEDFIVNVTYDSLSFRVNTRYVSVDMNEKNSDSSEINTPRACYNFEQVLLLLRKEYVQKIALL